MSDGFAYIDILFFAMVAAFIALRLRSVLGRRTGHERRRPADFGSVRPNGAPDNVVALPDRFGSAPEAEAGIADLADGKLKAGLTQIRLADQRFDLRQFLQGARNAFDDDRRGLQRGRQEGAPAVAGGRRLQRLCRRDRQRQAAGQTLDTQLISIRSADVVEAGLHGSNARIEHSLHQRAGQRRARSRRQRGRRRSDDRRGGGRHLDLRAGHRDTPIPNWALVETRAPAG